MTKKQWPGNPCSLCDQVESTQHLFFLCPVARVVWRTVGAVLGTDLCPNSLWQYYVWCNTFLPDGEHLYTVGLASVC